MSESTRPSASVSADRELRMELETPIAIAMATAVPPAIEPQATEQRHLIRDSFNELWRYRELLYFFAWRDVKVRYRQAVMGAAWAVMQPLFTMIIFTLIFGKMAHMPSNGIP